MPGAAHNCTYIDGPKRCPSSLLPWPRVVRELSPRRGSQQVHNRTGHNRTGSLVVRQSACSRLSQGFLTGLKAAHRRLYRRREQSASYRPGLGQQIHNSFGACSQQDRFTKQCHLLPHFFQTLLMPPVSQPLFQTIPTRVIFWSLENVKH